MNEPAFKPEKMTFIIAGTLTVGSPADQPRHQPSHAQERLFIDGREILPGDSLKIRNHSPSGFAWGYSGSGAAQTALAVCLHIFRYPAVAEALYQDFKATFVAHWPLAKPFNQEIDITEFMLDHWSQITRALADSQESTHP